VLLTLVALLAVVGTAALPLVSKLPDPADASREDLLRWVVTQDLNQHSPKTRLVLACRLEQEYRDGVDWQSLEERTTETQRRQIWKNIPLLLEHWLYMKSAAYSGLSSEKRQAFVDDSLDMLSTWRGAEQLCPRQDDSTSGSLLSMLVEQVEKHRQNADPQQREQMTQYLLALEMRSLARKFGF